jgi:hypothetical protein
MMTAHHDSHPSGGMSIDGTLRHPRAPPHYDGNGDGIGSTNVLSCL